MSFGPGTHVRYPAGYPRPRPGGGRTAALVSRCLSAAGVRFPAILSRLVFRPSYDRPAGTRCRTMTGFARSAHTRYGRSGRPLYPGTGGALAGRGLSPARRLPLFHGTVLSPRPSCHLSGAVTYEASVKGSHHSPARPSPHPWPPDDTGNPLALPLGSAPTRAGPAHARQGRDRLRARAWNTATSIYVMPVLQSARFTRIRATSCRTGLLT